MEAQHKRVEQKGRFTITEIIPVSSCSSHLPSPTFQDDEASVDSTMATLLPLPVLPCQVALNNKMATSDLTKDEDYLKSDETPEWSQTQQAETVVMVPVEADRVLASEAEAVARDVISERSFSTTATTSAPGSPLRKFSTLMKSRDGMQRAARRIKRRGRFTIIEMASDSPTSRKNSDEQFYDHRLVTTTPVEGSSGRGAPQHHSCSFEPVERRAKPKRAPRSMSRLRPPSSYRRSRRQTEGLVTEYVDVARTPADQQQQQEAAAYAERQNLPVAESIDALAKVSLTGAVGDSTGAAPILSASAPVSMVSVTIPDSERATTVPTPAGRPVTPPPQHTKGCAMNGSAGPSQTSPQAISTAQFLQQQRTIASLVRQQHDLKQIIGVLREQQQQLMSIPSQLSELNGQSASCDGRAKDEEMRVLHTKLDSLTRSNESLHSLLDVAEQEVRHRTLQLECLSEENDVLRHRCGQLELFLQGRRAGG